MVYLSYNGDDTSESVITYHEWKPGSKAASESHSVGLDLSNREELIQHIRHTFLDETLWIPGELEVNGRKGRRAVCVVAKDGSQYRVYDLDSAAPYEEPVIEDKDDNGEDERVLRDAHGMEVVNVEMYERYQDGVAKGILPPLS